MRTLLRFLTTTGRLLAAGSAACALLLLLAVGVGPRTGTYRTLTVLTGSMRPGIPEGSVIVSTPIPVDRVAVGDVITYRIPVEDRRVVTHRVVELVGPGIVRTQGDANQAPDTWIAQLKGQQVWKVRLSVPKAGFVLERLREPMAQRVLVLGAPFGLALLWMRDIWGRDDERAPEAAAVPQPEPPSPLRGAVALAALLTLGAACARQRA